MNTTKEEKNAKTELINKVAIYLNDNFHKFNQTNKIKIALEIFKRGIPTQIQGEGFANVTNIYNIIQQIQRDFAQKNSRPSLELDSADGLHDGRTRQSSSGQEVPQQGVSEIPV